MATMANRLTKKFKNYMCALVATNKTGIALEKFTEHGLQSVHSQIQRGLGNLRACTNQCSQHLGDINMWCMTCTRWRTELVKYFRRGIRINKIPWQKMKSWCWPNGALDIAEVFTLSGWSTVDINLQDISTIFNVWNRCLKFQRNVVLELEPLKECRNHLAHGCSKMRLTNARTKVVFQNINKVINHPDIRPSITNHADVTQMVRDLKSCKLLKDDIISSLRCIGRQNDVTKRTLNDLIDEVNETKTTVFRMLNELQKTVARQTVVLKALVFVIIPFLLIMNLFQASTVLNSNRFPKSKYVSEQHKSLDNLTSIEGCLSEANDQEPGKISLFEYISHHQAFIGREWLFKQIEMELQSRDVNNRGILLEAGMGYGKSALMKHIICASEQSPAHRLRSRLVAYHVCRFDVLVSKKAFVFVLRLIDMISSQMPILADEINSCKEIFDRKMCEKDPNGCLDQCIMIPLKTFLRLDSDPVIIAIDGLDECYDKYGDVNEILDLLKQRLYRFPPSVQFLISSRTNQPRLNHLTKDLLRLEFHDESPDNIIDIKKFIQEFSVNQSALNFSKFASADLQNFQLVTLLLEDSRTNVGTTFPTSVDQYYDEQFYRLFGRGYQGFSDAQQILEVMCTTFQPSTKDNIWNILSNTTLISLQQLEQSLRLLDNLIRNINGEFHIVSESLQQWLIRRANEDFFVNIENGHRMNALYIFGLIENGIYDIDIVDLAIHVDYTSEKDLRQKFLAIPKTRIIELDRHADEFPIVKIAKQFDSFVATDLLVSQFIDVDRRNIYNHTALYIAASLGYVNTFDALIKWNSSISFRTNSYNNVIGFENALKVSIEHMYWGYGVLDIAAQNGHGNIVNYILKYNMILFDYPMAFLNSMQLLPIHLACKKGHLDIVKKLHTQYEWMLDWQCLYYASEIGHINLVKYILENYIRDECRVCVTKIHWIPKWHLRVQGEVLYSLDRKYKYVLFDDWNNITCESALHVAVRENKLEVVKVLVNQSKNAAHCFDRGGKTPAVCAVLYGYRNVVEYFVSSGLLTGKQKCSSGRRLRDNSTLHANERIKLEQYFSEANTSVGHIVAKYDLMWVVNLLRKYGAEVEWNTTDRFGCYPLHQASCHGSLEVLSTILESSYEDFTDFKCHNGSNPLHSAVTCGSVSATKFLLLKYDKFQNESQEAKLSYIKHAVLWENKEMLAKDIVELEKNTSTIISMLVTSASDLQLKDEFHRNIFHYIIQRGHFDVVMRLFSNYPETAKNCLVEEDNSSRNPLYHAVHYFKENVELFIPKNGFVDDVLIAPLDRMSGKEYSLLLTLNFMIKSRTFFIDTDYLFKLLVRKQCLNTVTFLLQHPGVLDPIKAMSVIMEHDKTGHQLFSYLTIALLKNKSSDIFSCTDCQKLKNKCQLHLIALRHLDVFNYIAFSPLKSSYEEILELLFNKTSAYLMSKCLDEKGYNVLERAIQGGNTPLVHLLITMGVESDLQKNALVLMALNGPKYRTEYSHVQYTEISKEGLIHIIVLNYTHLLQTFEIAKGHRDKDVLLKLIDKAIKITKTTLYFSDHLIFLLLNEYHTYIRKTDICSPGSNQFSIIHKLAFECHFSSLRCAVTYWGKDILQCRNTDGFTPLYMSQVFPCVPIIDSIVRKGIVMQNPLRTAERVFWFKLLFQFVSLPDEEKHLQCVLSFKGFIPKTTYKTIKLYKCAQKLIKKIDNPQKSKIIFNYLKKALVLFIKSNTWSDIMMKMTEMLEISLPKQHAHNRKYINDKKEQILSALYMSINRKTIHGNFHEMMTTESRVCKYLRESYTVIKQILADTDLYHLISDNCAEIFFFYSEYLLNIPYSVRKMFRILNWTLARFATMRNIAFYFSVERHFNFDEVFDSLDIFRVMDGRYNYMNELNFSATYKSSFFNERKNINWNFMINNITDTLTFRGWKINTYKILENYLKRKGEK